MREGFLRAGIARAGTPPRFERFEQLDRGRSSRRDAIPRRDGGGAGDPGSDPSRARKSVVCLSAAHAPEPRVASDGSRIARYAAGADYHGTLRERAVRVAGAVDGSPRRSGFSWRVCVDSTPIAERSFAAAAGIGWIGKNGCLIDPDRGSFLLLAEIVTDLDLPPDEPIAERCGSCVRCLDACPT